MYSSRYVAELAVEMAKNHEVTWESLREWFDVDTWNKGDF